MNVISLLLVLLQALLIVSAQSNHKPGYCNTYGNCGKRSAFGSELPCVNFVPAIEPSLESKSKLVSICGGDESDYNLVCCSPEQIDALESNLKRVDPIISSCPACRKNFYDFFCKFTCSPNESTFINITKSQIAKDTGKEIVTEISQFVNPDMAREFFDSCKNVKFSATNGFAMDLIGGGAENYKQFLKFLGDEKPLLGGSPYQINFEYETTKEQIEAGIQLRNDPLRKCSDKEYKCACTDCTSSCPKLPHARSLEKKCKVGILPCFSFAILIIWLCLVILLGGYHVYLARLKKHPRHLSITEEDDYYENTISPLNYVTLRRQGVRDLSEKLNYKISDIFSKIGFFCSVYPGITIGSSLLVTILLSLGLFKLNLETNPVNLWVSPQELALQNQQFFESNFGEWFRIEQIIISSKTDEPILNWETIQWWFAKELELNDINEEVPLSNICFKPLDEACAIESFAQYFYGDINSLNENNWQEKLQNCVDSPVNCLPSFEQPLKPNLLFDNNDISKAKAFTITVLINSNSTDTKFTNDIINYEHSFQKWVQDLQINNPNINIAFSTEVSLTEELNKSTNTDIRIIVISYLVMFIYASLALGGKLPSTTIYSLVKTRFMLGLSGILIILLSVTASVGFFSLVGLKSTLIIAEVIPFLILAIGIDNIFLIVHELHIATEYSPDLPLEQRISSALGCIGPSCFISAILQVSMFLLATAVDMPAVKNFAFYSAGAILINFILQMTCFIGLLTLDQKRLEDNRVDCAPWITIAPVSLDEIDQQENVSDDDDDETANVKHLEYNFSHWVSKNYAPVILAKTTKPKILTLFVVWLGISLSLFPEIKFGLDQRVAIPSDSYLINYFNSVYDHFNAGPPMFFVVKNLDVTTRSNQQKICGRFSTCNEYSLSNILEQEFKRPKKSMIAEPTTSWLDDFLSWLNPDLDQCCRFKKSSVFEGHPEFCSPYAPERQCQSCYLDHKPPYDASMAGFPEGEDFMFYFNQWIQEPSDPCPLGGKAPYGNSIARTDSGITTSYFRTSHVALRSQDDFINAYGHALRIVDEIKSFIKDLDLFVWSPFYIFFVQYHTIIGLTFGLLGAAMLIIWIVSSVLLGSVKSATVMTITIISILINIGGVLAIWGVSLNAVSLVNLIICAGLAVEFTIHLTRAYCDSKVSIFNEENDETLYNNFMTVDTTSNLYGLSENIRSIKAYNALSTVGGSMIAGITLTKFIGISVLAFTRSKIFEIYYFRMWFALIIIAATHSLCLLPILLSYFGDDQRPKRPVMQISTSYENEVNTYNDFPDDTGPSDVVVTGSFVNWTENIPLVKQADGSFSLEVPLVASEEPILYKYVVDGVWQASQGEQITKDESGIENNVLHASDLNALSAHGKSVIPESGLSATVLPKEDLKQVSVAGEPGIQIPTQPEALAAFNEVRDVDPATLNQEEESPDTSNLTAEEKKKLKKKVKRTQYKAKKKKKAAEGGAAGESSTAEEDTEKEQTPEPSAPLESAAAAAVVPVAAEEVKQVSQEAKEAVVSAPEATGEVKEVAKEAAVTAPEAAGEVKEVAKEAAVTAPDAAGEVKEVAKEAAVTAPDAAGEVKEVTKEAAISAPDATEEVKEVTKEATVSAPEATEEVKQVTQETKEAVVTESSAAAEQIKTLDPKAAEPAEGKEVDASPVVKDEAPKAAKKVEDEEEVIIAEGDKDAIAAAIAAGHTLEEVEPTEEQKAKLAATAAANGVSDPEAAAKEAATTAAKSADKTEAAAKKTVATAKKEAGKEEKKKGSFRRFLKKIFS
ncbi:Niemann-Pick type C-related protein 1 [Spathaspora sp. JA1]|nr:Niemann-Pick type C-related protein 1 [Spathaspora sp. JA1]